MSISQTDRKTDKHIKSIVRMSQYKLKKNKINMILCDLKTVYKNDTFCKIIK